MLLWFVTFFAAHFSLLAYCRVRSVFPFILFSTLLHSHRNANPTQELSFVLSFRSISLHFTFRGYVFPTLHIHVVAALFRFTPQSFTTPHITPFRSLRFITLHSFSSYSPCLSHRTVRAKNPPNQLPAAPVHSAPRFLCPGHSLHSQRLAHNAQAEYFVPFLFTRISALLSTLAQGCFYYSV